MRRFLLASISVVAFAAALIFASCSDLKKTLPTSAPSEGFVHPSNWMIQSSSGFHGNVLKASEYNTTSCQLCHSKSYSGGTSGIRCDTTGCHPSYPHISGWRTDSSATYHGVYLKKLGFDVSGCSACHGTSFAGGTSEVSCYTCHAGFPHLSGWGDPSSPSSHGKFVKAANWQLTSCSPCHGSTYVGGTSGVSCFTCHSLYPHVTTYATGHPAALMNGGYPLSQCQTCHGSTYTGGSVVNVSCETAGCHVDGTGTPKSPEACNTCHGTFSASAGDFVSSAPPKSLHGDTATTVAAVGAHRKHLAGGTLSKVVDCAECHTVPASTFAAGHLGADLRAEVLLTGDTLAALVTGNGSFIPTPAYDGTTHRCSNVYCHGAWRADSASSPYSGFYTASSMNGLNKSPLWTGTSTEAACGTCHALPPTGHMSVTGQSCFGCHYGSTTLDKTLHMNGKISLKGFGIPERSF